MAINNRALLYVKCNSSCVVCLLKMPPATTGDRTPDPAATLRKNPRHRLFRLRSRSSVAKSGSEDQPVCVDDPRL